MRFQTRAWFVAALAGLTWPGAALAMPLPDCAGGVNAAQARIVRVEKDGTLVLRDGRTVVLEGIRLPGADYPSDPVAARALDALRSFTGVPLTMTVTPPGKDRYGRTHVQAFSDVWLQTEMLKRGLARVMIAPDRQECYPDFYEAEAEARKAGRGLWVLREFVIRQAASLSAPVGSFQIVEGRVVNVATHDGRVFLDFGVDYRSSFSVTIAPEDRKAFRASEPALEDLAGHEIRVRGIVENFNGRPEIALSNPRQLELLK